MRLCPFHPPGRGGRGGGGARDPPARRLAQRARTRLLWRELDRAPSPRRAHLLAPLDPPEVWGAGITYRRSREYYEAHTGEGGRTRGIYDYVYEAERPELFFKATAARTAGPNAA